MVTTMSYITNTGVGKGQYNKNNENTTTNPHFFNSLWVCCFCFKHPPPQAQPPPAFPPAVFAYRMCKDCLGLNSIPCVSCFQCHCGKILAGEISDSISSQKWKVSWTWRCDLCLWLVSVSVSVPVPVTCVCLYDCVTHCVCDLCLDLCLLMCQRQVLWRVCVWLYYCVCDLCLFLCQCLFLWHVSVCMTVSLTVSVTCV